MDRVLLSPGSHRASHKTPIRALPPWACKLLIVSGLVSLLVISSPIVYSISPASRNGNLAASIRPSQLRFNSSGSYLCFARLYIHTANGLCIDIRLRSSHSFIDRAGHRHHQRSLPLTSRQSPSSSALSTQWTDSTTLVQCALPR